MVLDTSLLNIQHYKVRIKGKVKQSRERSSALPLHFSVVAIEVGAFWSPSTTVANFTFTYMCFKREGSIFTLSGRPKNLMTSSHTLVDMWTSTESDVNIRLVKSWTDIVRLSIICKTDLSDKIKHDFFKLWLYYCMDAPHGLWQNARRKNLDEDYTRMQRAILNKSWKQHPTKQQLYSHLPLI